MFAVLKTGGKQYKVSSGDLLRVEKLAAVAGETIQFNDILMVGDAVGTPFVEDAGVQAQVIDQIKGKKVIHFVKRRRKHGSKRKKGHRQQLTLLRITEILETGAAESGVRAAVGAGSFSGTYASAAAEIIAAPVEAENLLPPPAEDTTPASAGAENETAYPAEPASSASEQEALMSAEAEAETDAAATDGQLQPSEPEDQPLEQAQEDEVTAASQSEASAVEDTTPAAAESEVTPSVELASDASEQEALASAETEAETDAAATDGQLEPSEPEDQPLEQAQEGEVTAAPQSEMPAEEDDSAEEYAQSPDGRDER